MRGATWSILFLGLVASGLSLAGEDMTCPDKVRAFGATIASEDVPSGYAPFVPSSMVRLTGVSVFDGPPEQGAVLKPSSLSSSGESIRWAFDGPKEERKWVSCDYANGLARLVRQVDVPASSCTASLRQTAQKTLQASFSCR